MWDDYGVHQGLFGKPRIPASYESTTSPSLWSAMSRNVSFASKREMYFWIDCGREICYWDDGVIWKSDGLLFGSRAMIGSLD